MAWLDTLVIFVIVIAGLFIFYKALKEPFDMLGRGLKDLFIYIKDSISNSGGGSMNVQEVLTYG